MNRELEEHPDRPRSITDVPHCSDISAEQARAEGACTVLWPLWAVGDILEQPNGYGGFRRFKVIAVHWNDLWLGAQSVTLSELHTPSRYVGADPFELRPLSTGLRLDDIVKAAEVKHTRTESRRREIGAWRDQRDRFARQRWQAAKQEAAGSWGELHQLRTARPVVLALPAPADWKPEAMPAPIPEPAAILPEPMPRQAEPVAVGQPVEPVGQLSFL